jgi:matrix metalloproteinase-14 (membrane-inserted)
VAPGYPRKISQDWPGFPSNIDAAFTWQNSKSTYFLKASKYWKFENMRPQKGYPKDMKDGFPGIPTDLLFQRFQILEI